MKSPPARTLTPYPFSPDFRLPEPEAPEMVRLTPPEFAGLLDEARAQGFALAEQARAGEVAARAEAMLTRLSAAMDDLVALARHIDALSRRPELSALAPVLTPACQRLIDGQGDLLAGLANSYTEETE